MASGGSAAREVNERVYVAVGRDVEESKSTLLWALDNFGGHFRILHVHQPNRVDSTTTHRSNNGYRTSQEIERENMHKTLDAYIHICKQAEVHASKRYLDMTDIGKGIVELIEQHAVTKLVMGGAANWRYSERMTELESTKAVFVNLHAHPSCQIWFVCRGHLIQRREGNLNLVDMDVTPSLAAQYSTAGSAESNPRSPDGSTNSRLYPGEVDTELAVVTYERGEVTGSNLEVAYEEGVNSSHEIYGQLERTMLEAENARQHAFGELIRHQKATERSAAEAMSKAKALENSYAEEIRRTKELEEILDKERERFEATNKQHEHDLIIAREQRSLLENRMASFERMVKELNENIVGTEELLQIYKKERDDMQVQRDNAVRATQELARKQAGEASSSRHEPLLSEFSSQEIERATDNFDPSMKIAEHRYGWTYRGSLHHTQVAIKMFQSNSLRSPLQFHQELEFMRKLRHPNVVTLIGACMEPCALIYEHLPNGNLEDRLICKEDTTPLSWQTRMCIATEICVALVFLHSNRTHCSVHGNLKPENILLDANCVAKLSEIGTFNIKLDHTPKPEAANFPHLDPHFLTSGELSTKCDVYSFGILLLQLLTGRSALNLARDMQDAINGRNTSYMITLLDPLAGEWPLHMATELARLALKCCDTEQNMRPDLGSEVLRVLEPIRATCEALHSHGSFRHSDSEEDVHPPEYFLCPISQEIMRDPHVAADGFTYEGEELMRWFNSRGTSVTSPMTGISLPNLTLVPNHTLRSAIQQWLQNH